MALKAQLENKKYRNWVRAGLGIRYVKIGLEPFCEDLVTQQHIDILRKVKQKHNLSAVSCGLCNIHTLQPDHVRTKSKLCPLGQIHCNCQYPGRKHSCPNNVCGAIYDEIIQLHASSPPAPNWKNTDVQQWCTEPWAVAKCFINAPGYNQKTTAQEFDCSGLLHLLINNKEFQQHTKCGITDKDVFTRVRKSRNEIFHSNTMEIEDTEFKSYIDDMIELLEDETEIKHRQESKDAVKKLLELKQEDFIISTTDEAEIRRVAMAAIKEIEGKGLVIKSELEQTGQTIRKELAMKDDEIRTTAAKGKHELEGKGLIIKADLEQKGIELEKQLTIKESEAEANLEKKVQESKLELETMQTLIEESMKDIAESKQKAENKQQDDNNRKKAEFQGRLVKQYEKYARKVPSLPLQPNRNQRNINDVYVPSWMTVERKDEESAEWKEVKISMHEIFRNDEKPAKYIYVLGEAGSGKSMFCKILVHFWCIAHSCSECSLDKSDIVEEMGNFRFLFYVSLRHCSDCDSIEKMLEKSYHDPALEDILQNEPDKCLIVLDGLDEWIPERKDNSQFLTPGLPGRKLDADYTIITTSRQWKFDALPITDSEVDKKIKLRGIDQNEIEDLTEKTVKMLNDIFRKSKNPENCKIDLEKRPVSDIIHIPLILQQLIFLWFDDTLRENSKYAIYSSMLALFLEWNARKSSEYQESKMTAQERSIYLPLPDYLYQFDTFRKNTRVIQYLSHLAYKTLFDKDKESTLTFSNKTLERLKIPDVGIKYCLNAGILTEEHNVSVHASVRHQSSYSFYHKSMQEYLAAVFVASRFKEMMHPRNEKKQRPQSSILKAYLIPKYNTFLRKNEAICKKCVLKYFGSCKSVVDILEQSNVFIMLCGLEPELLTNVSEYIFNVATVDRMMVEERNKVPERYQRHNELIQNIQACIFRCIDEIIPSQKKVHMPVYIADLYVSPSINLEGCDKNIIFKNVLTVEVDENVFGMTERDKEAFYLVLEGLGKCDQLKAMKVKCEYSARSAERIINAVTKILVTNVSTLETISLLRTDRKVVQLLISIIPKMQRLVSLHMTSGFSKVSHELCLSLGKVLNQATRLQHISFGIECEKYDQHMVDLSKHKQLQQVDTLSSSFYVVSCNTDNLERCKLDVRSSAIMNQLCNILYNACKLKHLELCVPSSLRLSHIETTTVTEDLIRLLPSLVNLRTLTLEDFTFTGIIITCPTDMRKLKEIRLKSITMSMTTWCKFLYILPALPQSVHVKILYIRDEKIAEYIIHDARQYVRGKANLFRVTRDDTYHFEFTTRKV